MLCPVAQQQADSSRIGISIGSRKKQQPGLGVRARAAAPAAAGRGLLHAGWIAAWMQQAKGSRLQ
jgi:hypothetical protein